MAALSFVADTSWSLMGNIESPGTRKTSKEMMTFEERTVTPMTLLHTSLASLNVAMEGMNAPIIPQRINVPLSTENTSESSTSSVPLLTMLRRASVAALRAKRRLGCEGRSHSRLQKACPTCPGTTKRMTAAPELPLSVENVVPKQIAFRTGISPTEQTKAPVENFPKVFFK